MKFMFIFRYNNFCINNEEAAVQLLYVSLVKSIWLCKGSKEISKNFFNIFISNNPCISGEQALFHTWENKNAN